MRLGFVSMCFIAACAPSSLPTPPSARALHDSPPPPPVLDAGADAPSGVEPDAAATVEDPYAPEIVPIAAEPSPFVRLVVEGAEEEAGVADTPIGFRLEPVGFPAVSGDGKSIALAFGEDVGGMQSDVLLTVEIRDIDSGAVRRRSTFRESRDPPSGTGHAYAVALRKHVDAWLTRENRALDRDDWHPLHGVEQHWACRTDVLQSIIAGPLRVTFNDPVLEVDRSKSADRWIERAPYAVVHSRAHPEFTASGPSVVRSSIACSYSPGLAGVYVDEAIKVLVVELDHCVNSHACDGGIPPSFAVVRIP